MSRFLMLAQGGVVQRALDSLPTDPVSLFVLALCAVAIAAVFIGGRGKGKGPDGVA